MAASSVPVRARALVGRALSRVYETASHSTRTHVTNELRAENDRLAVRIGELHERIGRLSDELAAVRAAQDTAAAQAAAAAAESRELNRALVDTVAMLAHTLTARTGTVAADTDSAETDPAR